MQAQLGWGVGTRMSGRLQFYQLNLAAIMRHVDPSASSASGLLAGSLDFEGTDVRSVDDITATLQARLNEVQAFEYPVLRQIAPYLGGQSSSSSLGNGDIQARLAAGIVRIERLALEVRQLPLYMQGTATLGGGLNLDVTVKPRRGNNTILAGLLGAGTGTNRALPVALLSQVTQLVARQLVHLRVTGTVRSPVIEVEPPPVLSQNALRFLFSAP
jgi:hypothetical protein